MEKLQDKGWLKQKYVDENMSMRQIGDLLGCTKHPVYRALKKHGLQARAHTSKYPQLNDKEWLRDEYLTKEKSVRQIAQELGVAVGVVHSALTHMGTQMRGPKEAIATRYKDGRFGSRASNWQGGVRLLRNGYLYRYSPDHPFATKMRYVMEHRLLMEAEIGRYLEPQEVVHHISGDKSDNSIENLQLLPDRETHAQVHFENCKEVAYLKKVLEAHDIKYKPYEYECLKYLT